MHDDGDRYRRGLAVLRMVGGEGYDEPINALRVVAPALARFTVEFAYGDVMARPALDLKTRQLCTVAALAALGTAAAQLRYHIAGARNVGASPEEIVEVLLLAAVYAGFPAALNGIAAARDVFRQRGEEPAARAASPRGDAPGDRYARGLEALGRVTRGSGAAVVERLHDIAPDLGRYVVEFSYGDVIDRPLLDDRTTELATVAMCAALGTAQPQLAVHVHGALNVGASREEVVEAIQQLAVYAGFPAALNGIGVAGTVFADRDAHERSTTRSHPRSR
jgi:4-carboxymuconolactone decarboxylase